MKKSAVFAAICCVIIYSLTACGGSDTAPKAGSASADDMLKLLPVESMGVFFVDFQRAMSIEAIGNAIQEDENYEKYMEFVEKTGIDPKKDVFFIAASFTQTETKGDEIGAGIVNLKYDPEALLNMIKEKAEEEGKNYLEEEYNGIQMYLWEEEKSDGGFAFLDASNAIVGNKAGIKSIIDVVKGTKENIYKNEALSDLLGKTNKKALLWGAIVIPQEAAEKAAENPMTAELGAVKAVILSFDYTGKDIKIEIIAEGGDGEKNKKIADMLNGLKALGGMAADEKPEIGELINSIDISANDEHVKLDAELSLELLTKLKSEIPISNKIK